MSEEQGKTHATKAVSIQQDGLMISFQENGCIIINCGQCGEESHIYPDDEAFTSIIEIMGGHA